MDLFEDFIIHYFVLILSHRFRTDLTSKIVNKEGFPVQTGSWDKLEII